MISNVRKRGEAVRQFILEHVERHPNDIAAFTAQHFNISRQAVNKHLKNLVDQAAMVSTGNGRNKSYAILPSATWQKSYLIADALAEDIVWSSDIAPLLKDLPGNVREIWAYGFTEMFNNALEHSAGTGILVSLMRQSINTKIMIFDDGEGIFRKIQKALTLADERHAVLELAKGKLTTDPKRHSGEGIFFASRIFDRFVVFSGHVCFSHQYNQVEDWIQELHNPSDQGTLVMMSLDNKTARTSKQVFDEFSSVDDYSFTKTVVPVKLAQYGDENLISRSQAKRMLARVNKFAIVIFDFKDVETIGQSFADEIFRVFANQYPGIEITWINADPEVRKMISRAEKLKVSANSVDE
jgi:anti-sigma regulatory factor (Ser/Thr protein kinase)